MRINTNVAALNSQRILMGTGEASARSIGRLSSGFRINRAGDDAAGLAIANSLRADIRSLRQATRNAEQAGSVLQIAEGATQNVQSMLERMKELGTQAASDNVSDTDRVKINDEFEQLRAEISRTVDTTKFQGKLLLSGGFGNSVDTDDTVSTALAAGSGVYQARIQGAAAGAYTIDNSTAGTVILTNADGVSQSLDAAADGRQSLAFTELGVTLDLDANYSAAGTGLDGLVVSVDAGDASFLVSSSGSYTGADLVSLENIDLTVANLGVNGADNLSTASLTSSANAQAALTVIDTAISDVGEAFGKIGAAQNRIDYAKNNVRISVENMSAAESTIRDADMAAEMTEFTRNQILQQAGVAMLAQANSAPQQILRLLG
jgi:flagellin